MEWNQQEIKESLQSKATLGHVDYWKFPVLRLRLFVTGILCSTERAGATSGMASHF